MQFTPQAFSWLNDEGKYLPGWSNVEFSELAEQINTLLSQEITEEDAPEVFKAVEAFDAFLNAIGIIEPDRPVLSIKIDDGELLEAVVGPAIYAAVNDDGERTGDMLIRVGDYTQPVTIDGTNAFINGLKGDVSVEERGTDDNKYVAVMFEVYLDVIEDSIEVPFTLDVKNRPEIADIKKGKLKKIASDGGLPELLKVIPSGESFSKPRDLEVGEYGVISLEENDPHPEYGRSWKVVLEGVGPMMTTGKRLTALLTRNAVIYEKHLAAGNPLTFAISNKEELKQGIRVDCGFFKRAPKADRMVAAAKPIAAIAQTPEVAALPQTTVETTATAVTEQQELVHSF